MPKDNVLTVDRVLELLDYDPATGIFTWRVARGGQRVGAVAGSRNKVSGYCQIGVDGKLYQAHRIAWLITHGSWPVLDIDHINCIRDDNRIDNLREATRAENVLNVGIYKNNASGHKGVYRVTSGNRWVALARLNGKQIVLGRFQTKEAAAATYEAFARQHHGKFLHQSISP